MYNRARNGSMTLGDKKRLGGLQPSILAPRLEPDIGFKPDMSQIGDMAAAPSEPNTFDYFGGGASRPQSQDDIGLWLERNQQAPRHEWDELGPISPTKIGIGTALNALDPTGSVGKIGSMYSLMSKDPSKVTAYDKFSAAANLLGMGGPTTAMSWVAGLPGVKANPIATYSGEGKNFATAPADKAYRAGASAKDIGNIYYSTKAEYNKGGAGNPQHVGEQGYEDAVFNTWNQGVGPTPSIPGIADVSRDTLAQQGYYPNFEYYDALSTPGSQAPDSFTAPGQYSQGGRTQDDWNQYQQFVQDAGMQTPNDVPLGFQDIVSSELANGQITPETAALMQSAGLALDQNGQVVSTLDSSLPGLTDGLGDSGGFDSGGGGGYYDSPDSPAMSDSGYSGGDYQYSKGGIVQPERTANPPGPDTQYISAQPFEAVLNRGATAMLGPKMIKLINALGEFR